MSDRHKPKLLARPRFASKFRRLYVDEGRSLEEVAELMGCTRKAAARVRDYLGLEKRPRGRPKNPDNDEGREYVPPRCPYPNLPFQRGAFRNIDGSDVEMVARMSRPEMRRAA